jgi:hypothetical protein
MYPQAVNKRFDTPARGGKTPRRREVVLKMLQEQKVKQVSIKLTTS